MATATWMERFFKTQSYGLDFRIDIEKYHTWGAVKVEQQSNIKTKFQSDSFYAEKTSFVIIFVLKKLARYLIQSFTKSDFS